MADLVSFGSKRDYSEFKKHISLEVLPLFDKLRNYCLSLGKNVVEDVRMHRVVFGKTMSFRWFADLEPQHDGVIIKIQKSRKEPTQIVSLKLDENTEDLENLLKTAFSEI